MDENLSDDEIFFGKMTLKEAKKLIFKDYPQRQTISYSTTNEEHDEDVRIIETHSEPDLIEVDKSLDSDLNAVSSPNIVCNNFKESDLDVKPNDSFMYSTTNEEHDEDVTIIETHSEPDLIEVGKSLDSDLNAVSSPNIVCHNNFKCSDLDVKPDDSFIRFEKMVSELCMSPTDKHPKLDNTLEVVDFILNNVEHNKPEVKVLPCLDDINLDDDDKIGSPHSVEDSDSNTINVQTPKTNLRNENDIEYKTVACVTPKTILENSCNNIGVGSTDFASVENTPKDNVIDENNIRCETTTCDTLKTKPESYNTKVYNTSKVECTTKINPVHNIPEVVQTPKTNLRNENDIEYKTVACVTPKTILENSCNNIGVGSTDFASVENTPKDNVIDENNIRCETTTCDTLKTKPESYNTKVYNTSKVECTTKINPVHNIPEVEHDTNLLSVTPKNKLHMNNNTVFKTPKIPVSSKKITSAKKTPSRLNTYQHITSPVASYIKNCPQVPLVKDVHPQRPLPPKSSIPQPIKNVSKTMNKENIEIPTVAYKSAKKTQMVTVPSQEKMPKGEWTSKLTSSLKKPVVITHGQRVVNNVAKNLNKGQEDSFANLTLQQAEISVCTKKSAF